MDRDKFLESVRKDGVDEGMEDSKQRGLQLGYRIFSGLAIFLILFNLIIGENSYSIHSLFWAFVAAEGYKNYQFSHEKKYRIQAIAGAIASAVFLLNHILYSLG